MGIELDREKVKTWMENNKEDYMAETEDKADCAHYMIADANYECETSLENEELEKIANTVMGL